jgi:hypothetical protein
MARRRIASISSRKVIYAAIIGKERKFRAASNAMDIASMSSGPKSGTHVPVVMAVNGPLLWVLETTFWGALAMAPTDGIGKLFGTVV